MLKTLNAPEEKLPYNKKLAYKLTGLMVAHLPHFFTLLICLHHSDDDFWEGDV